MGTGTRIKRTHLVTALVLFGGLAVAGIALAAPGDVIQTMNAAVSPSELPEKERKNAELQIIASACYEGTTPGRCRGEAPQVPDYEAAVLEFLGKGIAFNPDAAKQCKDSPNSIADLNPAEARSACGRRSVIGGGFAVFNLGQSIDPADVTVFNGKKQGGNPTVLLHAYASSEQGVVFVGVMKHRNELDITIEPLAPGTRLATFGVDIKKGKYVQARCTRSRKHPFKGTFSFTDAPDVTVRLQQPCQVRN